MIKLSNLIKSRWPDLIVITLMVIYVVWFSFLSIRQHNAFITGGFDLGNMDQSVWTTSRGWFLRMTTVENIESRLGGHADVILVLLAPLYWIAPNPRTLLILQTVILASGGWAAYRLAQWKLGQATIGVIFALVYLLAPIVQGANLFQFHPVAFASAFLLFALYYMLKGDFWWFAGFAILTAISKEEMPLIIILLGLYHWIFNGDRRGAWLSFGAFVWFLIANLLIIPAFTPAGENIHYIRYERVGGSISGIIQTAMTNPIQIVRVATEPARIDYLIQLLFPVGYLSLFSPIILLLSAPSIAVNILSDHEPMIAVDLQHYSAPIWPFVIASAILGIDFIVSQLKRVSRVPRGFLLAVLVTYLLVFTMFNHFIRGRTPLAPTFSIPQITPHHELASRFLDQVPPQVAVSAQNPFVPHLSHRPNIYTFPRVDEDTEWLLLDVGGGERAIFPFDNWTTYHQSITPFLNQDTFGLVDAADGYLLLRRGAPQKSVPQAFYTFAHTNGKPPPEAKVAVNFSETATLIGLKITQQGNQAMIVESWWQQGSKPLKEYTVG
ncbi:MAG: DUF2079 domain-containing protein, partial [Chloroflexota bacterium]